MSRAAWSGRQPVTGTYVKRSRSVWRNNCSGRRVAARKGDAMLGTILIIILILLLLGALPSWGYSRSWGYYPSGGLGLILIIVILLVVLRVI